MGLAPRVSAEFRGCINSGTPRTRCGSSPAKRRSRRVAASGEHGTSHPVACRRGFACPGARNRLRVPSGGLRGRGGLGAAHRRVGRPLRGDSAGHCVQSSSHQRDSGARSAPSGRPESFVWPGDRARSAGTRSTPCGPAFRGDQRDVGGIRVSRPKTRRLARTRRRRHRSTDDVATSSLVIQIDCRPPPTVSWSPKASSRSRETAPSDSAICSRRVFTVRPYSWTTRKALCGNKSRETWCPTEPRETWSRPISRS